MNESTEPILKLNETVEKRVQDEQVELEKIWENRHFVIPKFDERLYRKTPKKFGDGQD
jgi:hypothetical protein